MAGAEEADELEGAVDGIAATDGSGAIDELDEFDGVDLEGIDPVVYRRRWQILAVLCTSLVIILIGNTVLNVALPTLQRPASTGGVGASNTQVQWMVDAYGLVFAGLLFTAAALGDRFGRRGALQAGLLIFAAGSAAGALADTSAWLIAARAVMGVGAAFVMPSTLSILTNVFPTRERARAIAIWAGISGSGAAIGPLVSGFLLDHFWWGSVFLINLPIIALALVAGWILVPRSRDDAETPLDPVGAALSIVGLSALVYAIIEGPRHGWLTVDSALWFGGALVALVAFVVWELRSAHPMLDLHLFKNPRFAMSSGGISLAFFAMFGTFFLLTQYLQGVLDYSPLGAAVRMLPFSLVMMAMAPQTPKLVARLGADVVGCIGLLLVATGMAMVALLYRDDSPYLLLVVTFVVLAAGMGMTMIPMTTQLMAAVPRNRAGMGSATNDTTRELGGALGVAVLGSVLTSQYQSGVSAGLDGLPAQAREIAESSIVGVRGLVERGLVPPDVEDGLLAVAKEAFVDGFRWAAAVSCVVAVATSVTVKRILPSDRDDPSVTGEPSGAAAAPTGPDLPVTDLAAD